MLPLKIQIETVTPKDIDELKKDNEKLRQELKQLTGQHRALHETVYHLLERFGTLQRSLKNN